MTNVRKEIRDALKRSGETPYWLAKQADIRVGSIYTYLKGKSDMNGEKIGKLIDALGLEIRQKGKR